MSKLMFYCQHILGMGHLIRSIEIVKGLIPDFQICFINGGQVIENFKFPPGIEVVNIPALKTDSKFKELKPVDENLTMEEVKNIRKNMLLDICDRFRPDVLIIELYPFGRRPFSFELIPLIQKAKSIGTKVVSSVRDILVTKQNQQRHEEKVCQLINQYFDMVLIHGDPNFINLDLSFSSIQNLTCPVHYTGYVVQPLLPKTSLIEIKTPSILVSVGGGRFGHDLLECVVNTAPLLAKHIPHHIQVFTGAFSPPALLNKLQTITAQHNNITVDRYTPNLLNYMQQADLSIGMAGYNTTMNILSTGVRAMMMAFQGNNDKEQEIRVSKLDTLGRVNMIYPEDLEPKNFGQKMITYLQDKPTQLNLNLDGVVNTNTYLKQLINEQHQVPEKQLATNY
ncbi:MAG: glycosyltransferase [Xenococcaceae cyanobacterium MO_188.B19]|nr:glycosyltransferase [Xenococcaceae cyanobacterium MO_188.B19]